MSMTVRQFRLGTRLARSYRSRLLSTSPPKPEVDAAAQKAQSRIERTHSRLPRFLQKYTAAIRHAPTSHLVSFLVLHEATAVFPLFGLVALFHYTNWMPSAISEGKWATYGVQKFGNYFRRKGWLGEEGEGRWKWWGRGEGTVKIVVEFGTAYAIVKALLPLRIIFSVWAAPAFARAFVLPFGRVLKRLFTRAGSKPVKTPSAAGTGAIGAGAVAKNGATKAGSTVDKS